MNDRPDGSPGLGGFAAQNVSCRVDPFTTALPLTLQLARRFYPEIVRLLGAARAEWPFEDRVLVWLLPNMEAECAAFHDAGGGDLASHFVEHQLESIDDVLAAELLRRLNR